MPPLASQEATILPGLKPVLELLANAPHRVDGVFCKKGLRSPEMLQIQALCRQQSIHYSLVAQEALDRLCHSQDRRHGARTVSHQGVVARLTALEFHSLAHLLASAPQAPLPVILALDQVQDPGNVGTLCRTLYALGGAGLLLPLHNSAYLGPAAHRASAGALEHLPIARVTNLAHALEDAADAGFAIYGSGAEANSQNALVQPMVLGNENKGLRPGVAKRCPHMLHIPLARDFDSLNVAQAGAILLGLTLARQFSATHGHKS